MYAQLKISKPIFNCTTYWNFSNINSHSADSRQKSCSITVLTFVINLDTVDKFLLSETLSSILSFNCSTFPLIPVIFSYKNIFGISLWQKKTVLLEDVTKDFQTCLENMSKLCSYHNYQDLTDEHRKPGNIFIKISRLSFSLQTIRSKLSYLWCNFTKYFHILIIDMDIA